MPVLLALNHKVRRALPASKALSTLQGAVPRPAVRLKPPLNFEPAKFGSWNVTLHGRCKSDTSLVSFLRRAVLGFAKLHGGFPSDALDDIELAVGEALANAAEHGHREGGWISTSCSHDGNKLRVIVRDSGPPFDYAKRLCDPVREMSPRGYGLRIMRSTMDDVCFENGGRVVTLTKMHVTAATGAAA